VRGPILFLVCNTLFLVPVALPAERRYNQLPSALFVQIMKGLNTPGQELERGGVAFFTEPRGALSHLAFPVLAR